MRDGAAVKAAIADLPPEFTEIDVLVNNAGLALGPGACPSLRHGGLGTDGGYQYQGLLYCTRAILPGMVARDRGHVINIGSVAGSYPYPGGNAYGGTKAFVKQFSLNLRADLLGTQVRVTNIEPGLAESEFSLVRFKATIPRPPKSIRVPSRCGRRTSPTSCTGQRVGRLMSISIASK